MSVSLIDVLADDASGLFSNCLEMNEATTQVLLSSAFLTYHCCCSCCVAVTVAVASAVPGAVFYGCRYGNLVFFRSPNKATVVMSSKPASSLAAFQYSFRNAQYFPKEAGRFRFIFLMFNLCWSPTAAVTTFAQRQVSVKTTAPLNKCYCRGCRGCRCCCC